MSELHRFRTGIRRFPDGWNVVVEIDGQQRVYDPTFATEAEAEAKATETAAAIRALLAKKGVLS